MKNLFSKRHCELPLAASEAWREAIQKKRFIISKSLMILISIFIIFSSTTIFSEEKKINKVKECQKIYTDIVNLDKNSTLPSRCDQALDLYRTNRGRCLNVDLGDNIQSFDHGLISITSCYSTIDMARAKGIFRMGISMPDSYSKIGNCSLKAEMKNQMESLMLKGSITARCLSEHEIETVLKSVVTEKDIIRLLDFRGKMFGERNNKDHQTTTCLVPFAYLADEFKEKAPGETLHFKIISSQNEPEHSNQNNLMVEITGFNRAKNLILVFHKNEQNCYYLSEYEFK